MSIGKTGAGDLIYITHEQKGGIFLNIDHWGMGGPKSTFIPYEQIEGSTIVILWDEARIRIKGPTGNILQSEAAPYYSKGPIYTNQKAIGFTTAIEEPISKIDVREEPTEHQH